MNWKFVHFTTNDREAADALVALLRSAGWEVASWIETGADVPAEPAEPFFNAVLQKPTKGKS